MPFKGMGSSANWSQDDAFLSSYQAEEHSVERPGKKIEAERGCNIRVRPERSGLDRRHNAEAPLTPADMA